MESIRIFLAIAGAVALLLYGLGLVRQGATDAFGVRLRAALGAGTKTGMRAFLSGLVATVALQSSTATALLTASFVERGLVRGTMAQIVLLGANLGTAISATIIASGIEAIGPVLILVGYIAARRTREPGAGIGKALIGVGLMLLSLTVLGAATEPLRHSEAMAAFLAMLDAAWPVALVFASGLTFLCASSMASVLLAGSLVLSPALAVVLVLGANMGGAVTPVVATAGQGVRARRVAIGNLIVRATGCLVALPFAGLLGSLLQSHPVPGIALVLVAHLVFNVVLAAVAWPWAGLLSRALERMLPGAPEGADDTPRPAKWLDEAALSTPVLALAGASREALDIGDMVGEMLDDTRRAFRSGDMAGFARIDAIEAVVDARQQQVKTYLSRLGPAASEDDRRAAIDILDHVINLEHVGDIIDKGLVPEVRKKIGMKLRFSEDGYRELDGLFLMTQETLRLAQTVFMTRNSDMARQLIERKVEVRNMERESAQRHLMRLRNRLADSIETSSLHLDMLRDLKRINAHLVAVAHPILDAEGLLVESRLRAGAAQGK